MTRLLLHEVFIKMKKLMHSFIHLVLFFYFELYLNSCSKEMFTFICVYYCRKKKKKKKNENKKEKVCSKYFLFRVFCHFSQTTFQKTTVSLWTRQMGKGRSILCQKHSCNPLLDASRNRNNTVCGYVNLKSIIEEFQEVKFRSLLESLNT